MILMNIRQGIVHPMDEGSFLKALAAPIVLCHCGAVKLEWDSESDGIEIS